jgi:hypothetical protein
MSRCQLLPVSSTQRRPRLVDPEIRGCGQGLVLLLPDPAGDRGHGGRDGGHARRRNPSDSLTFRTAGCRMLRTSSPMCCPALVKRGRTIDPDPKWVRQLTRGIVVEMAIRRATTARRADVGLLVRPAQPHAVRAGRRADRARRFVRHGPDGPDGRSSARHELDRLAGDDGGVPYSGQTSTAG